MLGWLGRWLGKPGAREGEALRVAVVESVYLTAPAKLDVITASVRGEIDEGRDVALVAQFRDSGEALRERLEGDGLPVAWVRADGPLTGPALAGELRSGGAPRAWIVPGWKLAARGEEPAGGLARGVVVVAAERHPLPERDRAVAKLTASLCGNLSSLARFVSLEDAGVRALGVGNLGEILARLGAGEHQNLDTAMVVRALDGAQRKLARRVGREVPEEDSDRWLAANCPWAVEPGAG